MSKRRLKFSKMGMGKYISHLDLLRAFTRAISRAGLPVRYTQGFNPHQIMTFSLPLPIGVTSETEFVDVDFESTIADEEIIESLNKSLPPDIRILSVGDLVHNATDISCASYEIEIIAPFKIDRAEIESFFEREEIPVVKKTKKGDKEVNLKDYIKSVQLKEINQNKLNMTALLSAGGSMNIKPDIMISAMEKEIGKGEFDEVYIHRTAIFVKASGVIEEMR